VVAASDQDISTCKDIPEIKLTVGGEFRWKT
ncbi:hypothetical protein Tco_1325078, partial [Tanacetum coccineum]